MLFKFFISKIYLKFTLFSVFCFSFTFSFFAQNLSKKPTNNPVGTYVKTYVTKSGKVVKGHMRKKVSTDPKEGKNRTRSKIYYHTKGKYRRKKS